MNKIILTIVACLTLISCVRFSFSGLLPFGNSNVNERYTEKNELYSPDSIMTISDSCYRIYCSGDVHYNGNAKKFKQMANAQKSDNTAQLNIILGDLTDTKGGLPEIKTLIEKLNINSPVVTTIGNHDLYFDQWNDYKNNFGTSIYSFTIKGNTFSDLFICLDTGNGTIGSKQKKWLEQTLKKNKDKHRHIFVFTHTNIWDTDNSQVPSGNLNTEESLYLSNLFDLYNIDIVLMGHDHTREIVDYRGVKYITLDAIKDENQNASYLTIDCAPNKLKYNFITLQ